MTKMNSKKGFTLIEILFVLALISIVVGIGLTQLSGATDAAKKAVAKADVRSLIMAESIAFSEGGAFVNYDALAADNQPQTSLVDIDVLVTGGDYCAEVEYVSGKFIQYNSATPENGFVDSDTTCTPAS